MLSFNAKQGCQACQHICHERWAMSLQHQGCLKQNFTYGPSEFIYYVILSDIRIANTQVFKEFDPSVLRHRSDVIDVYISGFANFHTGAKTYPLLSGQEDAFKYGTTRVSIPLRYFF